MSRGRVDERRYPGLAKNDAKARHIKERRYPHLSKFTNRSLIAAFEILRQTDKALRAYLPTIPDDVTEIRLANIPGMPKECRPFVIRYEDLSDERWEDRKLLGHSPPKGVDVIIGVPLAKLKNVDTHFYGTLLHELTHALRDKLGGFDELLYDLTVILGGRDKWLPFLNAFQHAYDHDPAEIIAHTFSMSVVIARAVDQKDLGTLEWFDFFNGPDAIAEKMRIGSITSITISIKFLKELTRRLYRDPWVKEQMKARQKKQLAEGLSKGELNGILLPRVSVDEYVPGDPKADRVVVAFFASHVPEALDPLKSFCERCRMVERVDVGDSDHIRNTSICYVEFDRPLDDPNAICDLIEDVSKVAGIDPEEFSIRYEKDKAAPYSRDVVLRILSSRKDLTEAAIGDHEEDGWYERQDELESGQVFSTYDGSYVMLDRMVAGDGTKWFVANWLRDHFSYEDGTIEPGDLRQLLSLDGDSWKGP